MYSLEMQWYIYFFFLNQLLMISDIFKDIHLGDKPNPETGSQALCSLLFYVKTSDIKPLRVILTSSSLC